MNLDELSTLILTLAAAVAYAFVGEILRIVTPYLKRVFLPGAVLGGGLALCLGPQINPAAAASEWVGEVYGALSRFPPLFINVVFACLMLAKPLDGFSVIWERAKRQVVMGHVYAWGQYVVGLSLTLFLLAPLFSLDRLAGVTIAIGFQGGHGTAAGLQSSFQQLGFGDGKTIAYALATFGIVVGAALGPVLATWLSRQSPVEGEDEDDGPSSGEPRGGEGEDDEPGPPVEFSPLTGKLTLHLALVGIVIAMGWSVLQGIQWLESTLRSPDARNLFSDYIPLFSVVLMSGFLGQYLLQKLGWTGLFHRSMIDSIAAFALDMVIVGALATLSIATIGSHWLPILILCAGGLAWNLAVFFLLGPRIYPLPWHPYGLGDLGGGTATTASGLLLIRVADPKNRTQAKRAYSEKQPFYEPFMGGGLVTAFALPLVATLGVMEFLLVCTAVLAGWLVIARRLIEESQP